MTEKGKSVLKKTALYTGAVVSIVGIGCLVAWGALRVFLKVLPKAPEPEPTRSDEYDDVKFV